LIKEKLDGGELEKLGDNKFKKLGNGGLDRKTWAITKAGADAMQKCG